MTNNASRMLSSLDHGCVTDGKKTFSVPLDCTLLLGHAITLATIYPLTIIIVQSQHVPLMTSCVR